MSGSYDLRRLALIQKYDARSRSRPYRVGMRWPRLSRRLRFDLRALSGDVPLALAVTVFAQLDLWFNVENATHYGSDVAAALVTFVATSVLVLRRRAPLLTVCVVAAAAALPELAGPLTIQLWGDFLPILIATYSVTRHTDRRTALTGLLAAAAALVVVELQVPVSGSVSNIPFIWVPFVVVALAGAIVRARELAHAEVRTHARALESRYEETVRAAVLEERNRIARELHDIVAHCVSVMVMQAGAAEDLLDREPERAPGSRCAPSRRRDGRRSASCGRMLGPAPRRSGLTGRLVPQPGAGATARVGGRRCPTRAYPCTYASKESPGSCSPGVDVAIYRVAQEALTNTLKHAGPATSHRGAPLRRDDGGTPRRGRRAAGVRGNGEGHGLIGMRERVALYGGALEAGTAGRRGLRGRAASRSTESSRDDPGAAR